LKVSMTPSSLYNFYYITANHPRNEAVSAD
jgi:hypothetical protein